MEIAAMEEWSLGQMRTLGGTMLCTPEQEKQHRANIATTLRLIWRGTQCSDVFLDAVKACIDDFMQVFDEACIFATVVFASNESNLGKSREETVDALGHILWGASLPPCIY